MNLPEIAPRAVIFDLDGTLYSLRLLKWKMAWKNRRHFKFIRHLNPTRKALRHYDFGESKTFYRHYFELFEKNAKEKAQVIENWYFFQYYPHFIGLLKHYTPRPGVIDVLKHLQSQSIKTGLLSEYAFIDERLTALGIDPAFFKVRLNCEDIGALKPHSKAFQRTAQELKVAPQACWYIGDRQDTDGEGARAAGMKATIIDGASSWTEVKKRIVSIGKS